jgi:hypothetical protein
LFQTKREKGKRVLGKTFVALFRDRETGRQAEAETDEEETHTKVFLCGA